MNAKKVCVPEGLYRLTAGDVRRAGEAMADAFVNDPLWRRLFDGETEVSRRYPAFFEVPVRHCLRYGDAYAPTQAVDGVMAFVPGSLSVMTLWRLVRSGSLGAAARMGPMVARRMAELRVLDADRAAYFAGRRYLYLMLLGVRRAHQGRGLGGSMLRALLEHATARGLPVYLETETEENVQMYEHFGFQLIRRIHLKSFGLPVWEMVREVRGVRREKPDGDD